jgi:uncharacterized protein with PQ loop repeat
MAGRPTRTRRRHGFYLRQGFGGQDGGHEREITTEGQRKMQMSAVFEVVGTTGSLIVCASAIPQVVKTCRIKRSRDLSIAYLSVLMLGIGLLQSYSLYVRDLVFILGNTLSMLSTGLLIVLWFRYRDRLTSAQSKQRSKLKAESSKENVFLNLQPSIVHPIAGEGISLTEQASFLHNVKELS